MAKADQRQGELRSPLRYVEQGTDVFDRLPPHCRLYHPLGQCCSGGTAAACGLREEEGLGCARKKRSPSALPSPRLRAYCCRRCGSRAAAAMGDGVVQNAGRGCGSGEHRMLVIKCDVAGHEARPEIAQPCRQTSTTFEFLKPYSSRRSAGVGANVAPQCWSANA